MPNSTRRAGFPVSAAASPSTQLPLTTGRPRRRLLNAKDEITRKHPVRTRGGTRLAGLGRPAGAALGAAPRTPPGGRQVSFALFPAPAGAQAARGRPRRPEPRDLQPGAFLHCLPLPPPAPALRPAPARAGANFARTPRRGPRPRSRRPAGRAPQPRQRSLPSCGGRGRGHLPRRPRRPRPLLPPPRRRPGELTWRLAAASGAASGRGPGGGGRGAAGPGLQPEPPPPAAWPRPLTRRPRPSPGSAGSAGRAGPAAAAAARRDSGVGAGGRGRRRLLLHGCLPGCIVGV